MDEELRITVVYVRIEVRLKPAQVRLRLDSFEISEVASFRAKRLFLLVDEERAPWYWFEGRQGSA